MEAEIALRAIHNYVTPRSDHQYGKCLEGILALKEQKAEVIPGVAEFLQAAAKTYLGRNLVTHIVEADGVLGVIPEHEATQIDLKRSLEAAYFLGLDQDGLFRQFLEPIKKRFPYDLPGVTPGSLPDRQPDEFDELTNLPPEAREDARQRKAERTANDAKLLRGMADGTLSMAEPEVTPEATTPKINTSLAPQVKNPTQADLKAAQANTDRMAEGFARKTAEPAAQRAATPEPPRPEIITLGPGDLVKQVKEALEARKNSKRLLLEVTPEVVTEYLKTLKIPVKKMWGKTIYATMQDSSTAEIVGNQLVIYGEISAGKGEGPFGGGAKFIVKLENNPSGIGVQPINFDPDNPEHLLLTGQAQGRKEKIVEAIPHLNETIIEQLNGQLKEQKLESWQLKDFRIDIDKGKLTFDAQR